MKKQNRFMKKQHRVNQKRWSFKGALCFFLAVLLLGSVPVWNALIVRAEGKISHNWDDEVWDDKIIKLDGLSIKQSLDDTDSMLIRTQNIGENGDDLEKTEALNRQEGEIKIQVPSRENTSVAMPEPEIKLEIKEGNPEVEYSDPDDVRDTNYSSFGNTVKDTRTYYHVVTEETASDSFNDFEESVRELYRSKSSSYNNSDYMLMTREEKLGRAYDDAIEQYMEEKGYLRYTDHTEIPLMSDGKPVMRIDMLTLTDVDFNLEISVKVPGFLWIFSKTEVVSRSNYDYVLYTPHSYTFEEYGEKASAPQPELESGKNVQEAAIKTSLDDVLTSLNMVVPSGVNEEDYAAAYTAGRKQYFLSDTQIKDFEKISWKEWTGEAVPLKGGKYLYTRVVPYNKEDQSDSPKVFLESDPKEYKFEYYTDNPQQVTSVVQVTDVLGVPYNDTVVLETADSAQIFYTLDGTQPSFTKISPGERENLDQQCPGVTDTSIELNDIWYVRVNNLWYKCSDSAEKYTGNSISIEYKDYEFGLYAAVVQSGKKVGSVQKIEYQKLHAPTVELKSGSSIGGYISQDDFLVDVTVEESGFSGTLKYALSNEEDFSQVAWKVFSAGDTVALDGSKYLYTLAEPDPGSSYVKSCIGKYTLKYLDSEAGEVKAEPHPGTDVTESENESGDTVNLTCQEQGGLIFYTLEADNDLDFVKVTDESILSVLKKSDPGKDAVYHKLEDGTAYVRVNNIWYACPDNVFYYDGPIALDWSTAIDGVINISARALADGKSVNNYTAYGFSYRKVQAPTVELESGSSITSAVSSDDGVVSLNNPYKDGDTGYEGYKDGTYQYYLSDRKMDRIPDGSWLTWNSGDAIPLNRKTWLYTRFIPATKDYLEDTPAVDGYMGSDPCEYELKYIESTPKEIEATAYAGGEVIEGGVDYGDKIELIELEAEDEQAMIFYTLDGSRPSFKKVSYQERLSLKLDDMYTEGSAGSVQLGETRYVKVNGLWYECGDATMLYVEKITVDEDIYEDNYLTVNAQAIVDGCIISAPDRFTYSFSLRDQVEAPTASPQSGEQVEMGSYINLLCKTTNSKIFYTLNGSAPVVSIRGAEFVLGENTYEYTGKPIVVTEEFAEYGSSLTITAQAGCYGIFNGVLARTMKDSPLMRFTYAVNEQAVAGIVTSVPATGSDNRTEIEIGSTISLGSSTEGASIFYTLDGTEPVFDEETLEPKNDSTRKYNPSSGIQVPEITESSLLTITAVAYKDGLAASDVARLIFQYPSAVSAPYASPSAGSVTEGTLVTLRTATEGAVIYYEIAYGDETPKTPTEDSNVFDPSNPFAINKKTTIRAYAVKNGMDSPVSTFTYQVADKLSMPEPTIASGSVVAAGTVVGLEADEGATIYYTVDGSDPKKADNKNVLVGESVIINGDVGAVITIRTYAARNGYSDSELGYYSYSISAYEGGIFADLESGSTVKNGETIHLNTDVSDADIYYTTDGSTPTTDSAQGSTVTISGAPGENVIVKAIAIAEGTDTAISSATFTYTIMDKLAGPSASVPDGAVFTEEGTVTLTSESGKIYYTTNGEDPSTASNLYKRAIVVDRSMTIKAVAVDEDYEQSEISTFTYGFADQVAAPQANFASGELEMGTTITFTCETEGASIYYRTDGTDPDPDDKSEIELYTGPILIEKAVNFKVIAVKEHMQDSKVVSVGYTVREPAVAEEAVEEESQTEIALGGRLQSRRSFSGAETGPSFTDIVLRNATYQVVVSGEEGSLPDNVQLKVEPTQVTEASQRMVKQMLSDTYGVVASYEVNLLVNDEEVEPEGEIEIGLPIPADYANSIIHIVHLEEDGSIEIHDARRSGGIAYAKVDKLHTYSIAAPVEYEEEEGSLPWLLILYITAVSSVGLLVLFLYRSRKKKKEGGDWYA